MNIIIYFIYFQQRYKKRGLKNYSPLFGLGPCGARRGSIFSSVNFCWMCL